MLIKDQGKANTHTKRPWRWEGNATGMEGLRVINTMDPTSDKLLTILPEIFSLLLTKKKTRKERGTLTQRGMNYASYSRRTKSIADACRIPFPLILHASCLSWQKMGRNGRRYHWIGSEMSLTCRVCGATQRAVVIWVLPPWNVITN